MRFTHQFAVQGVDITLEVEHNKMPGDGRETLSVDVHHDGAWQSSQTFTSRTHDGDGNAF